MKILWAIFGTCFAGGLVQGATGIGFSMLCMASLPSMMPFKDAVICVILLNCLFTACTVLRNWGSVSPRAAMMPICAGFLGGAVGFWLLETMDDGFLKICLGGLLIGFSAFALLRPNRALFPASTWSASLCGTFSGIFGGICNVSGPPLVIYFLSLFSEDKARYFATLAFCYLVMSGYQLSLHVAAGNLTPQVLGGFGAGALPSIAGYWLGQKAFRAARMPVLVRAVYGVLLLMGVVILFTG